MYTAYLYLRSLYQIIFKNEDYDWFKKYEMEKKFFHRETVEFDITG